ncbi:hypothetical protein J6590_002148 [Homalodisca vitripennis]|nr:hypothetical protein J6590_002148 [Homalodisca vitripennis]
MIRELKSHNTQLETLVLNKEETIILLEKQINGLHLIVKKLVWPIIKSKSEGVEVNKNLPLLHLIPKQNKREDRAHNPVSHHIVNKEIDNSNRYEVLTVEDDADEEKEESSKKPYPAIKTSNQKNNKKQLVICADSHGRDLAWHINAV